MKWTVALICIPVSLAGVAVFSKMSYDAQMAQKLKQLKQAASIQQLYLEQWLQHRTADLKTLNGKPAFQAPFSNDTQQELAEFKRTHPLFQDAAFYDRSGLEIVPFHQKQDYQLPAGGLFADARQWKATVLAVNSLDHNNPYFIAISIPVETAGGSFGGMIVGLVSAKTLDRTLSEVKTVSTSRFLLIDASGRALYRYAPAHSTNHPLLQLEDYSRLFQQAHRQSNTPDTNVCSGLADSLCAASQVDHGNWLIVASLPYTEKLKPYLLQLWLVVVVVLLTNALLLFMMDRLWVLIMRPLKHLHRGAAALQKSRYDYQIHSDTIARLPAELRRPLETFNEMARVLNTQIKTLAQTEALLRRSEKLSVVGLLASAMAHEIRNPLTSVKGFLQLMHHHPSALECREQYFPIMLTDIERIELILSELLVLSKPQALHFHPRDIRLILQQTLPIVETEASLRGVQLLMELPSVLPLLDCEDNQLKHVFIHVLKNAIEAMPHGGTVVIQVRTAGDKLLLRFTDQGEGMSREMLNRIGEPFYSTKEQGMGLGLTICYKIVENHAGRLQIHSTPGRGTTVEMVLPIHRPFLRGEREASASQAGL
ncbi:sensor histidine kinase [Paenibacillus sp. y28]